jgi:hypothetical protein
VSAKHPYRQSLFDVLFSDGLGFISATHFIDERAL